MEDLIFSSIVILLYIAFGLWDSSRNYAATHGYFLAKHKWARKIVRLAESLIRPEASFCDNKMEFRISQYLENRVCGYRSGYSKRAEVLKEFYMDESKILWMLLTVSYETMLFASFEGTELAIESTRPYQEVFDAAAKKLTEMGFDCTRETEKCKAMTAETHEFCCVRDFSLYK